MRRTTVLMKKSKIQIGCNEPRYTEINNDASDNWQIYSNYLITNRSIPQMQQQYLSSYDFHKTKHQIDWADVLCIHFIAILSAISSVENCANRRNSYRPGKNRSDIS